jgi:hypothetical protein
MACARQAPDPDVDEELGHRRTQARRPRRPAGSPLQVFPGAPATATSAVRLELKSRPPSEGSHMSRPDATSVPLEHEPTTARFKQLFGRDPDAQDLARFRSAHQGLVIGLPTRIRGTGARRVARLILGGVTRDRAPRHRTPTKRTGWQLTRCTDAVERSWTIRPRPKRTSSPPRRHPSGVEHPGGKEVPPSL